MTPRRTDDGIGQIWAAQLWRRAGEGDARFVAGKAPDGAGWLIADGFTMRRITSLDLLPYGLGTCLAGLVDGQGYQVGDGKSNAVEHKYSATNATEPVWAKAFAARRDLTRSGWRRDVYEGGTVCRAYVDPETEQPVKFIDQRYERVFGFGVWGFVGDFRFGYAGTGTGSTIAGNADPLQVYKGDEPVGLIMPMYLSGPARAMQQAILDDVRAAAATEGASA